MKHYLIDTLSNFLDEYASIFSYYGDGVPTYGQQVKRTIDNAGYSNEHTIALGANMSDKLYLGIGFGITSISYSGHYVHREIDEAQNVFDFVNFTYTDHFNAIGSGWNFKFGAIVRPVEITAYRSWLHHTYLLHTLMRYFIPTLAHISTMIRPAIRATTPVLS
ncbi:MAG: hypothetical protein MZV63_61860 [Marinilabiliales bacterium]|nr:hypothetical protein [Marinilabiliales bacterium]